MIETEEKVFDLSCPTCKQHNKYDSGALEEAASLTCPICSTRFSISAAIQEPVGGKEDPGGLPGLPTPTPSFPTPSPSVPPSNFGGGAGIPAPESTDRVGALLREVGVGGDCGDAIERFLDEVEKNEKTSWKGLLSAFTNKVQSMVNDIGYDGDAGDMISEFQNDGVMEIVGDEVEVDLSKMKKTLMSADEGPGKLDVNIKDEFDLNTPPSLSPSPSPIISPSPLPGSPLPTSPGLGAVGGIDADVELPKKPELPVGKSVPDDKEDGIDKAIETYFC